MTDLEVIIEKLKAEAAKLPKASPEHMRIAKRIKEHKRALMLRGNGAARNLSVRQGNRV